VNSVGVVFKSRVLLTFMLPNLLPL